MSGIYCVLDNLELCFLCIIYSFQTGSKFLPSIFGIVLVVVVVVLVVVVAVDSSSSTSSSSRSSSSSTDHENGHETDFYKAKRRIDDINLHKKTRRIQLE